MGFRGFGPGEWGDAAAAWTLERLGKVPFPWHLPSLVLREAGYSPNHHNNRMRRKAQPCFINEDTGTQNGCTIRARVQG